MIRLFKCILISKVFFLLNPCITVMASQIAQSHSDNPHVTSILKGDDKFPLPNEIQAQLNHLEKSIPKSSLPICNGGGRYMYVTGWDNCFGTLIYSAYVYSRTEKYIGEFKDNKAHGFGIHYFASGSVYIGQHQNGNFQGQGILINVDKNQSKEGIWEKSSFKYAQKINFETFNTSRVDQKLLSPEINKAQLTNKVESSPAIPISVSPTTQTSIAPAASASIMNPGKRVALVIGNQAYNVRPLLNPRNDADDMSRALKNSGFEVIDVRDASLSQMRNAVRQFGDRLLTRDVGLVYYSGHGIEMRGRNYFIPVNADIKRSDEIADQSLDVNLILEKMETAKKGVNILIVDACRDDPFGRSFRTNSRGLATMDAPQGTIIAFATSPGKVAADGEGRNSPYTKNLIKTMQIPNLPIEQVFKQVRRAVQQETKNQQTPWENTSLSGDFYFSVKK